MHRDFATRPGDRPGSVAFPRGDAGAVPGRRSRASRRRGSVTLWTLLCLPIVLALLAVMVEVDRLWQARVHLENALEAAALAAVQEWADREGGAENVAAARAAGAAYARANTVLGAPLDLDDPASAAAARWGFGRAELQGTAYAFYPGPEAATELAVVVEARVEVPPFLRLSSLLPLGEATVAAEVAAYYDTSASPPRPRLIRIR